MDGVLSLATTKRYGARELRDHLKDALDRAEGGSPVVVDRDVPVALVDRASYDRLLAKEAPFDVQAAVSEEQVALWIDGVGIHGVGATWEAAEADFLDELIEYAEAWSLGLGSAPNHAKHRSLVHRVALFASDRDELRRIVFETD